MGSQQDERYDYGGCLSDAPGSGRSTSRYCSTVHWTMISEGSPPFKRTLALAGASVWVLFFVAIVFLLCSYHFVNLAHRPAETGRAVSVTDFARFEARFVTDMLTADGTDDAAHG